MRAHSDRALAVPRQGPLNRSRQGTAATSDVVLTAPTEKMATRRRLSSVPKTPPKQDIVEYAREVIRAEAEALAQSGETDELLRLLPAIRRLGAPIVAITSGTRNSLADRADVVLEIGPVPEACPLGLAPTASTVALLALGDALAMAVQHRRGFSPEQFAELHPAGALGRRLLRVREVMRTGAANPTVSEDTSLRETAAVMGTVGRPGAASVVDANGRLVGIFTDGDLRRLVQQDDVDFTRPVSAVMGRSPRTIGPDDLAVTAAEILREGQIDQLPVVDADGRPVGIIDVQDLLSARLLG